jgi:hypothetical protein
MTFIVDGTTGLTFNDSSTQNVTALNAANINAGTLGKARLPTGSVLQVVQATTTTEVSTTSSSYVNTGFSASITPTSATSKILILGSLMVRVPSNNGNYQHNIYRNNSTALAPVEFRGFIQCRGGNYDQTPAFMYLDSPNTTSSTSYNWYHKSEAGGTAWFAIDNSFAQITLMEIAA